MLILLNNSEYRQVSKKNINSHIIPQHHLKQFANDRGCIFTYPDPDKHGDAQCISKGGGSVVKRTASEEGYYSEVIETVLDQKFENQGSDIAYKILRKEPIKRDEREFFVKYIASFIYRVPFSKKMIERSYHKVSDDMKSVEHYIEEYYGKVSPSTYYQALNHALTDPTHKNETVKLVWEKSIETEHALVYNGLLSREWWVAEVGENSNEYFITSNNPLYYSSANGMVDRNVQFTFPLSQTMAMVFDGHQKTPSNQNIEYCLASQYVHDQVDLINKRTADNSTHLYSPKCEGYVQSLIGYQVKRPKRIKRKI